MRKGYQMGRSADGYIGMLASVLRLVTPFCFLLVKDSFVR